jgi:VanZ family protein
MREQTNPRNTRQTLLRRLLVVGTAGWAALIFTASSIPGSGVPSGFGSAAHYVEYAVFGALLRLLLATTPHHQEPTLSAIAAASAYGVTDEVHQAFVPMRTPDPVDWVVDTLGALSGAGLAAVALRAFAHRKRQ